MSVYDTPRRPLASPVQRRTSSGSYMGTPSIALFGSQASEAHKRHVEEEKNYVPNRDTLISATDETSALVKSLIAFNQDKWAIRYPEAAPQVLTLDVGHTSPSITSLPALIPTLALSSISSLFSRRLTTALSSELAPLRARLADKTSRVLVTGDLNAGKSTFVNALLRREVMPIDQQPCTSVFCEILDYELVGQQEIVHALKPNVEYDPQNSATFDSYGLEELERVMEMCRDEDDGGEGMDYTFLKVYVKDDRTSVETEEGHESSSFIHNGLVDISLIDAPGLNVDTLSTTALFSKQHEIDVIVFLVSAENHFTLSGKEFLGNAGKEKDRIFVVVNKWNSIRDKQRCARRVGDQIKTLSNGTWTKREELVHHVDSSSIKFESHDDDPAEWTSLEQSLRRFILLNRSATKFGPAKRFLHALLHDLSLFSSYNLKLALTEQTDAENVLKGILPGNKKLKEGWEGIGKGCETLEEASVNVVSSHIQQQLSKSLEQMSCGNTASSSTQLPEFRGLGDLWTWAEDIRKTMVVSLESQVREVEEWVKVKTAESVELVQGLGKKEMNEELENAAKFEESPTEEAIPIKVREFNPNAMFKKRREGLGRIAMAGHSRGLGLGTAVSVASNNGWSAPEISVTFMDLFDFDGMLETVGLGEQKKKQADEEDSLETTTALVSIGIGGIGMVGSKLIGVKGTLDSVVRALELLGRKEVREWGGVILGVAAFGFGAYLIYDLPRAVPKNIGKRLAKALLEPVPGSLSAPPSTFVTAHSQRISTETRKVLRLASWELRERYRVALEASERRRKEKEAIVEKSKNAVTWLRQFDGNVAVILTKVDGVEIHVEEEEEGKIIYDEPEQMESLKG